MTSPSETIAKAGAIYVFRDATYQRRWTDKPRIGATEYVPAADYNALALQFEAMKREMAEKDERIAELRRMAADRAYMMQAYRNMLGPKALDVAEMWDRKGVFRQHTTWGPEAIALTGEERAQVLLDVESAISTPIDDLDSELPTPQEPAARARTLIQGEKNAE